MLDLLFSLLLASCRTSQRSPSQSWPHQVSRNSGGNATVTFESNLSVSVGCSQAFSDQDPREQPSLHTVPPRCGHLWLMFIALWLQGTSPSAFDVHLPLVLFYVLFAALKYLSHLHSETFLWRIDTTYVSSRHDQALESLFHVKF